MPQLIDRSRRRRLAHRCCEPGAAVRDRVYPGKVRITLRLRRYGRLRANREHHLAAAVERDREPVWCVGFVERVVSVWNDSSAKLQLQTSNLVRSVRLQFQAINYP